MTLTKLLYEGTIKEKLTVVLQCSLSLWQQWSAIVVKILKYRNMLLAHVILRPKNTKCY